MGRLLSALLVITIGWTTAPTPSDDGWEQRVVDVETENGDIVADGINYNCALVHCSPIIHRLTTILDTCDLSDEAATALTDYIQELQAMVQDPIFKKEIN
jgi:hypothetical protein